MLLKLMCLVSDSEANSFEFLMYSSIQWTGEDFKRFWTSSISLNSSAKYCRPDLALWATSLLSGLKDPCRILKDFSMAGIDLIKNEVAWFLSCSVEKIGLALENDDWRMFCVVLWRNGDVNFKFASLANSCCTLFPDIWNWTELRSLSESLYKAWMMWI